MLNAYSLALPFAFTLFQTPERDLSKLVPVFVEPAGFNPAQGEHMRFGSFIPDAADLSKLISRGVSFFMAETDRLGVPDANEKTLLAQRAAIKAAGGAYGESIFTTFPGGLAGEGAVNVQTQEVVPSWSLWNPERIRWSANRYGAINRKFPKLDFVSLGVYGEYGDASVFTGLAKTDAVQSENWKARLGVAPPSAGFWAGDSFAKESWKKRIETQYGSVLNAFKSWGIEAADTKAAPIPLDASYPYAARLSFMDWYRSAVPSVVASLSDIGKAIFTDSPVMIPIGPPNDLPGLGLDIFRVAEAAARQADALIVTNVGYYNFADNWAMSLSRIRGAATATGIALWTEAPSATANKFEERLFESISLGARGHFDWPAAYAAPNFDNLYQQMSYWQPISDVAVLHPTSTHLLNPNQIAPPLTYRGSAELRDYADFDELEESAVIKKALASYRVAVLFEGTVWDARTLQELKSWVEGGGVLLAYDFGKMADGQGNTAIYQDLFGFASQLSPAQNADKWSGEIPNSYQIDLGGGADAEFLQGQWGQAISGIRPAFEGASLHLPVRKDTSVVVTVLFGSAPETVKQVDFISEGKFLAGVSLDGGLRQFKFAVEKSQTANGVLNIAIAGLAPGTALPIDSVIVAEADSESQPALLSGSFESPVDIATIKSWSRPVGKGRVIFFPGKRDQWKQFLSVVNSAIYQLSQIDASKGDARLIDGKRDRIYVVDCGKQLALFNDNAVEAVKTISINGQTIEVKIAPHSLRIVKLDGQPVTMTVELETLANDSMPAVESKDASPGTGTTAIRVSPGQTLKTTLKVPKDGRYKIFARTLRNGVLAAVRFKIGDVDSSPAAGTQDVYLVGEFELQAGQVVVQMSSDAAFLGDLLVLTDQAGISGFRFPLK